MDGENEISSPVRFRDLQTLIFWVNITSSGWWGLVQSRLQYWELCALKSPVNICLCHERLGDSGTVLLSAIIPCRKLHKQFPNILMNCFIPDPDLLKCDRRTGDMMTVSRQLDYVQFFMVHICLEPYNLI